MLRGTKICIRKTVLYICLWSQKPKNSLFNQQIRILPNFQQTPSLIHRIKLKQRVKKLIEILNKTLSRVYLIFPLFCLKVPADQLSGFLIGNISEFKAKTIATFLTLGFRDVDVFVVVEIREQAGDEDAEVTIATFDLIAFEV
jgi:hypothetical protein